MNSQDSDCSPKDKESFVGRAQVAALPIEFGSTRVGWSTGRSWHPLRLSGVSRVNTTGTVLRSSMGDRRVKDQACSRTAKPTKEKGKGKPRTRWIDGSNLSKKEHVAFHFRAAFSAWEKLKFPNGNIKFSWSKKVIWHHWRNANLAWLVKVESFRNYLLL